MSEAAKALSFERVRKRDGHITERRPSESKCPSGNTLVEREEHLQALRDMFSDAEQAMGSLAVISGPVAVGKSRLVHAFSDDIATSGAAVVHAVCADNDSNSPLEVLGQLFSGLHPAADADDVQGLLRKSTTAAMCLGRESEGFREIWPHVLQRLDATLRRLADVRPVLICVDDAHHCDVPSMEFLLYLARRLRSSRILMVLTALEPLTAANSILGRDFLRLPYCRRIRLSALSEDGVAALLENRLGGAKLSSLTRACHQLTGGNPLLLHALVTDRQVALTKSIETPEKHPPEMVIGEEFPDAILSCVRQSGKDALAVACGLAIIDGSSRPDVGELVGCDVECVTHVLSALNSAGVLDGDRFRHPTGRMAILNGVSAQRRSDLHRRAAQLLHEDGAAHITVAEHIVAAGEVTEPWMSVSLRKAARHAMAGDCVEFAVACLRLAAAASADPERLRLTALLAAAEWRKNPAKTARYLPELIAGVRCGHLNGRYLAIVVKLLAWYGRIEDVKDAIGSVGCRDDSPDRPTDRASAWVKLSLASWYPAIFDRADRDTSAIKRDPLTPELDLELDALTALANVMIDGGNDVTVGRAQRVLETARLDDTTLEPITSALLALVYAERIDKAARWCSALMEQADSRKAAIWQAVLATVHSEIAFRMGALPAAKSSARSALAHLPTLGWGVAIGAPLSSLLLASSAMGDFDGASRWLARPLPDTIFSSRFGVQYLYGRGSLFLATGRLDAALSDFTSCGELVVAWDMDLPSFIPWRTAAAAVYLAMGRQDAARSLIDDQLARPGTRAGRIRGITLRILAAASKLKERPVLLSEAIDQLQAGRDRFELARAVADLGQAQRALGQVSRSRMTYRFAETVATQCCAKPLLTAMRMANRSEGPPKAQTRTLSSVDGVAALSDAERRVAVLAVRGDTNGEIARRLFITVSTVEQHLTRVYRKLNVTGRTELPASLSKLSWEPGFVVGPVDVLSSRVPIERQPGAPPVSIDDRSLNYRLVI